MEMRKLNLISVVTLVWCLAVVVQGFTYDDKEVETEEGKSAMFERWRSHHRMKAMSPSDKKKQYNNFKANLEHVHKTNKANKPYKLQLNRFAGMTHEEVLSKHTGLRGAPKIRPGQKVGDEAPFRYRDTTDLPPSFDWRNQGAVTPVKNQGDCASCYSFSAVDAVEGMHFIKTKELVELSTKEILDCCKEGTTGCEGGWMTKTFEYIEKNGGITTAKNYPYDPANARVETCNVEKEHDIAVQVGGHENVPMDEESLMKAVVNQPVSVSTETTEDFYMYTQGVLTAPCGTAVTHAMLLVGYDTTPDGTKYWIVKNSWGEEWGEKGYIKMLRGVPEKEGYCGITTLASYPTPDKTNAPAQKDDEPMVHGRRTSPDESGEPRVRGRRTSPDETSEPRVRFSKDL